MIETMTEIGSGLGSLMLRVFLILMPLLILLEWMRSRVWFKRLIRAAEPVFDPLGFRPQAIFPLMTGLIFGISYGAGVLIPQAYSFRRRNRGTWTNDRFSWWLLFS